MNFNFVTPETSTQITSNKRFNLKKDDTVMISFVPQVKDINPNNLKEAEHPAFVEINNYYDEISKSYFRFAPNVNDSIKDKVLKKESVKEVKKTLSIVIMYELSNGKVTGIKDLYTYLITPSKYKQFKETGDAKKLDDENFTLYKADYRITCTDENFAKWTINATNSKTLDKFPEADRKLWIEKAKTMFINEYTRSLGKELTDSDLIEKFGLDIEIMTNSITKTNPMSGQVDEDIDFSSLSSSSQAFGSK
jgi:hypothetical protein